MTAIKNGHSRGSKTYEPTPNAIRHACEKIQSNWSPRERAKRAGRCKAERWTPPNIREAVIEGAASEERAELPSYLGCPLSEVDW